MDARGLVDRPRDAEDHAVDRACVEPARLGEVGLEGLDRAQDLGHVRAVHLDVLARPDVAAKVAQGPAQEPRPEVEAQDERGLRDGLEEQRAIAAPAWVVVDLADERRVEEGLQRDRDRRLGDAGPSRDLGARDGRAGADRLEHGALVEVLEQRRDGGGAAGVRGHRVRDSTA